MATVKEIIDNSASAVSGALTLDYILASSAPYNFSDFNYKISSYTFPTVSPESPFPNSAPEFTTVASAYDMIVDDESAKGSIHNIVNTKRYERVMEPTFGTNMARAVFQLFDDDMVDYTYMELTKAFGQFDRRLTVQSVQLIKSSDGKQIDIYCEIKIEGINRSIPVVFRNPEGVF